MNNLGKKAQDKITGFKGIIIGKITYLTGCDQYGICPPVGKDGKPGDTNWFDVKRVKILGEGIKPETVKDKKDPGGVNRDCPR